MVEVVLSDFSWVPLRVLGVLGIIQSPPWSPPPGLARVSCRNNLGGLELTFYYCSCNYLQLETEEICKEQSKCHSQWSSMKTASFVEIGDTMTMNDNTLTCQLRRTFAIQFMDHYPMGNSVSSCPNLAQSPNHHLSTKYTKVYTLYKNNSTMHNYMPGLNDV